MSDNIWTPLPDGEYDMGLIDSPLYIFGNTDPDVCTHIEFDNEEIMLDLGMTICVATPAPAPLTMPEPVFWAIKRALNNNKALYEGDANRYERGSNMRTSYLMDAALMVAALQWLEAQRPQPTKEGME